MSVDDANKKLIPDLGNMLYFIDQVMEYRPENVFICQVVYDRLQEEASNKESDRGRRALLALRYIENARLTIVPDPDSTMYDLLNLDDRHDDDIVIATYFELYLQGERNMRLLLSSDQGAKKAKRAERDINRFMKGDYSYMKDRADAYQERKKKLRFNIGKTGLANKREVKDQFESEQVKKFDRSQIQKMAKRVLISLAFLVGWYYFLSSAIESNEQEAIAQEQQEQLEAMYEIPNLAFDNIEIKLTEVTESTTGNIITLYYEMINRNEDAIVFGYYNDEAPLSGKKADRWTPIRDTIKLRFKNEIVDYLSNTYTLEPNQISQVRIRIDGPLENFVGIETYMQNEETGEVRKWSYDFVQPEGGES